MQDLARLLVGVGIVGRALERGERAQRRARESGRAGGTCSAVISESRPNSAWKRPGSPSSTGGVDA